VRTFDIRTYKEVFKFEHENYKCGTTTNKLCISSNSKFAIVGSQNGNIIIIDITKGELEEIYEDVHTSTVVACEWQPRGNKFASIDNLGGLYIWTP
jgi:WD40 repeat protein